MRRLSIGETLKILKDYIDIFVNSSGLDKYDINSLDYLETYRYLVQKSIFPQSKDNIILPEMKTFIYLLHIDALCNKQGKLNKSPVDIESGAMIRLAHTLWNWSNSKIIYEFDKDIEEDLISNSDFSFNSKMPVELLDYLPHNNFFVLMNDKYNRMKEIIVNKSKQQLSNSAFKNIPSAYFKINQSLKDMFLLGFFFDKDKIYETNISGDVIGYDIYYRITLMFQTNINNSYFCPKVQIDLRIPKNKNNSLTILDCIVGNKDDDDKECELFITKVLPYIFYLCSENAVIQERKLPKKQIKRLYKDKSNKYLPVLNIVSKPIEDDKVLSRTFPSISNVTELNEDDSEYSCKKKSSAKCPHERRSHWHRFWIGKKNSDERRLVLKWISAMKIRADLNKVVSTKIKVKSN